MTRKDELQEVAKTLVLAINEIQPEHWEATDERDCALILTALQQVEGEVWSKIRARMACVVEDKDALHEWVRQQQEHP